MAFTYDNAIRDRTSRQIAAPLGASHGHWKAPCRTVRMHTATGGLLVAWTLEITRRSVPLLKDCCSPGSNAQPLTEKLHDQRPYAEWSVLCPHNLTTVSNLTHVGHHGCLNGRGKSWSRDSRVDRGPALFFCTKKGRPCLGHATLRTHASMECDFQSATAPNSNNY
jgi:hypothetical protein